MDTEHATVYCSLRGAVLVRPGTRQGARIMSQGRLVVVLASLFLPVVALGQSAEPYIPAPRARSANPPACAEAPEEGSDPRLCVPTSRLEAEEPKAATFPPEKIDLKIPAGTPLRIAIDSRTRILRVGETVHGRVAEPVYAFDEAVIPAGSVAIGRVTRIDAVAGTKRALAYFNGDFSPPHHYDVSFDTLVLPDGKQLPIKTSVSPGTANVVRLVSNPEKEKQRNAAEKAAEQAKQVAGTKLQNTKNEARESWEQIAAPGRMERLKKFAASQMPYRRQYLEPGTRFNASLDEPLDFGETLRTHEQVAAIGAAPAPDSLLHARFAAEISSANATRGTPIAAVLTEPVFSPDHHLILPANSRLVGEVIQAKPAGKLHHNGELRVMFERIETPEGNRQGMQGNLESVEVDRAAGVKLDEEGGARATDSKTRYLSTAMVVGLAAWATHPEYEHGTVSIADSAGKQAGAGYAGTRITGALIGIAARSTPVSIAFGAYGSSISIYSNFLSRGHEVVFPKGTPIEVSFGSPHPNSGQAKLDDAKRPK
jgi:surface antigen